MTENTPVWGIHAGAAGEAEALFRKGNIALSWPEMGDMSAIPATREAFKQRFAAVYPDSKPGAIPTAAGLLFRFVHEMKPGDLVAWRSKVDRQIHLGQVTGPYRHEPSRSAVYPNQRAVTWERELPITGFSQGALYELGSAMSLFQLRNYVEEYRAAMVGTAPVTAPEPAEDETALQVAGDIEQSTRDFVLKTLARELKGHPLSEFVAHLLGTLGYRTRVSPPGPDGGFDIVAHKDELGFEPPIVKVQVKSTMGNVGQPEVSALVGALAPGEYGLVVTLGGFTPPATTFARTKANLRLIDGTELVRLVLDHYEAFDSGYKALLPLKRVYVPEVLAGL